MKNAIDSLLTKLTEGKFSFLYFIIFVLVIGMICLVLVKSEFMMISDDHYIFGYDYRECLTDCGVKPGFTMDKNITSDRWVGTISPIRKELPYGFIRSDSNNSR